MVIPKINSAHGSDTRNIINRAIDLINAQGKSIQDLVAEGQLTPTQYAHLVSIVNGNVKKGSITINDIDKNNFKIDQTYLTEELKQQMTGGAPINAVPADGSITREKLAPKAVDPEKVTFMNATGNLFNGIYLQNGFGRINPGTPDESYYITGRKENNEPRIGLIKVRPSTTYTVNILDDFDRLIVLETNTQPEFPQHTSNPIDNMILWSLGTSVRSHTFTTRSDSNYLLVGVSLHGLEPRMQVEQGASVGDYETSHFLPAEYIDSEITKSIGIMRQEKNSTVLENAEQGYPERPDALSVTWIGPNAPHDVEPLDEWRETEGFIHYANFSKDLSEWSLPWSNQGNHTFNDKLTISNPTATPPSLYFMSWDKANDGRSRDVEVYCEMKLDAIHNDTATGNIILRGSGTAVTRSCYVVGPRTTSQNRGRFRIAKFVGGSSSTIEFVETNIDAAQPFEMRIRLIGSELKLKVWQDGPEPAEWNAEVVDTSVYSGGMTGIFHQSSRADGTPTHFYKFGVGTGGMLAPKRRV